MRLVIKGDASLNERTVTVDCPWTEDVYMVGTEMVGAFRPISTGLELACGIVGGDRATEGGALSWISWMDEYVAGSIYEGGERRGTLPAFSFEQDDNCDPIPGASKIRWWLVPETEEDRAWLAEHTQDWNVPPYPEEATEPAAPAH